MYLGAVVVKTYVVDDRSIDENTLIYKIRSGRKDLFSIISSAYIPLINHYISALNCSETDREDFLQVGLLALSGCVDLYDFNSASFSTFVGVCVKRALLSELRRVSAKKQIPPSAFVDDEGFELCDFFDPEASYIDKENAEILAKKIKEHLSALEYKVLTSYLMFGSYSAVAQALSITNKEVNNALQRARKKIKQSIGNVR